LEKIYTALLVFMLAGLSYTASCQDTPFAVYEGSTACDAYIKQLTGIPANTDCDKDQMETFLVPIKQHKQIPGFSHVWLTGNRQPGVY
jgi:hypothetical protein